MLAPEISTVSFMGVPRSQFIVEIALFIARSFVGVRAMEARAIDVWGWRPSPPRPEVPYESSRANRTTIRQRLCGRVSPVQSTGPECRLLAVARLVRESVAMSDALLNTLRLQR